MLAQQQPGLGCEQADVEIVPLHVDALADPARRRAVVRGLDFDAAIEMDRPLSVAVIAKRLERQWAERWPLLGKHRRDLAFRRAVDPRIGPAGLPAIEVRLRVRERLEAASSQRGFLGVADARFDLAFAIRIADAARKRDDAVVREHIAIERIQRGIVDVRGQDTLFQIVEDDHTDRATQPTKRALMQLRPNLGARSPHEQPDRFARAAQSQDKEPRAAVLARATITHHRTFAVVDLAFFARRRCDDDTRLSRGAAA